MVQDDKMTVINFRRASLLKRIKRAPGLWLDLYQFVRVQHDSRLEAIIVASKGTALLFKRYGDS
jgi:hypothetical protein